MRALSELTPGDGYRSKTSERKGMEGASGGKRCSVEGVRLSPENCLLMLCNWLDVHSVGS